MGQITVVSLADATVQAPGKTGENRVKAGLLAETGVAGGAARLMRTGLQRA